MADPIIGKIVAAAEAAAASSEPRSGGMNVAWQHGYGAPGEYSFEARLFCMIYNQEADRLGKKFKQDETAR